MILNLAKTYKILIMQIQLMKVAETQELSFKFINILNNIIDSQEFKI